MFKVTIEKASFIQRFKLHFQDVKSKTFEMITKISLRKNHLNFQTIAKYLN